MGHHPNQPDLFEALAASSAAPANTVEVSDDEARGLKALESVSDDIKAAVEAATNQNFSSVTSLIRQKAMASLKAGENDMVLNLAEVASLMYNRWEQASERSAPRIRTERQLFNRMVEAALGRSNKDLFQSASILQ